MKVFFTASYKGKKYYQDSYDKIIESIQDLGHDVISLELQEYSDLLGKEDMKKLSKEEIHYLYIKKGIGQAHAVILEVSRDNFRLGHEATLALLYNKPVLCLSKKRNYQDNIIHPLFHADKYEKEGAIPSIIKSFIKDIENRYLNVRMDVTVAAEHKNFAKWYAKKKDMSTSELIRELIESKMNEADDYSEDLRRLDLR